jgi:predicted transposase/invertase (TIGR01784 family)
MNVKELKTYQKYKDKIVLSDSVYETAYTEGILEGIEKGIEQGIEQGIEKGIEKGKLVAIVNGFKKGLEVSLIAEILSISEDEVLDTLKKNDLI